MSQESFASAMTGCRSLFSARSGFFLFAITDNVWVQCASHPLGSLYGVRQPGREGNHSPQSSTEVRNVWSFTFTPVCPHDAVHADKFTPSPGFTELLLVTADVQGSEFHASFCSKEYTHVQGRL